MKKLEQFNPKLITEHFFPQYLAAPEQINYGQCFMWAYLSHQVFAGCAIYDVGIHAFIKHRGKFYDSERLDGVEDWEDLPATHEPDIGYRRTPLQKYTAHSFKDKWFSQTWRFNVSWSEMDAWAKKLIAGQ